MPEPDLQPRHTNRLALADSPYLQQHAHDPVDWYPWGEAAFAEARRADKPVFLSIGYSTCHWCHVMARTCFSDETIAEVLNRHFIAIKLDREQRPDLDEVYLNAVRLLSGQAGWPMSLWLTPDAQPFYGGTYFAPEAFLELLNQLADAWVRQRADVLARAATIVESLEAMTASDRGARSLAADLVTESLAQLARQADRVNGGFGQAPKFPEETRLLLQLQSQRRHPDEAEMVQLKLSLDAMSQGGLYDQVGGGFHRYAVDARWQVPHFEKMLFNQALLLQVYTEAYDITCEDRYLRVALDTADYVLNELRAPDGLFYAATDAESAGEEGAYFTWSADEIIEVLGARDGKLLSGIFNVTTEGNFQGRNVLHLDRSLEAYAEESGAPVAWMRLMRLLLDRLREVRGTRPAPHRDEQVITAWNALMIAALVQCAQATGQRGYGTQAGRAADALWSRMKHTDSLARLGSQGQVQVPGTLEDYSFFADALLQLYRYDGDERWLARARQLELEMLGQFWDTVRGGYYLSGAGQAGPMITRPRTVTDSALPSANAMAVTVLLRLYEATGDRSLLQRANACVAAFSGELSAEPLDACAMLTALDRLRNGSADNIQFAADGMIKVTLVKHEDRAELLLAIRPGWYVSVPAVARGEGEAQLDSSLKPLRVTSDAPLSVTYPEPVSRPLAFTSGQALVYQDLVRLRLAGLVQGQAIKLHLQACSDALCLPPQILNFRFFSARETTSS